MNKQFEIRPILPEETTQAIEIEQICFPPNEACSPENMKARIEVAPDMFLALIDLNTGKLAGFLNGLSTNEDTFRDEFFTDASLHENNGKHVMIFGLDVLPQYRRQGLAKELMKSYIEKEQIKGTETIVLTCLEEKIGMYERMGYVNKGVAQSSWGGEQWYEMVYDLTAASQEKGRVLDAQMENSFIGIMEEELIPAMGCTEPIALAYASAKARQILGKEPEKIVAKCSGNMIKNVRCVTIPNSNGMIGIEAACALGAFAGNAMRKMEVLEFVEHENREKTRKFLEQGKCSVEFLDSDIPLHFVVEIYAGADVVTVEVRHSHTNIARITRNDEVLEENLGEVTPEKASADRSLLSIENIKLFADYVEIDKVKHLLERQIRYNMDIAYEGMSGKYGLEIGKVIRETYADGVVTRMKAYAAAASEARMNGCDMPVIINSGSGNQGIASSVPVIIYARENNISNEKLYRALVFSSLLTTFQKEFIGKLSAFCGAVSASCASAAAITYLVGGSIKQIKDTIDNTLANIPGIICDGAKISCAAKIASSVDAAMMGHHLAMRGRAYESYTGILKEEAGETISCVGHIGKVGMRETDKEIIKMLLNSHVSDNV